jgi:hypothetical protein
MNAFNPGKNICQLYPGKIIIFPLPSTLSIGEKFPIDLKHPQNKICICTVNKSGAIWLNEDK